MLFPYIQKVSGIVMALGVVECICINYGGRKNVRMEEVDYPSKWLDDGGAINPKLDNGDLDLKDTDDRIPSHWDGDKYIGPVAPTEPDIKKDLAFEDQNFDPPMYITLARMYDLLAIIALKVSPESAEAILDLHEDGHLTGSPPKFALDDD